MRYRGPVLSKQREAAIILERLAAVIARGEITAPSGTIGRLEGAAEALRVLARPKTAQGRTGRPSRARVQASRHGRVVISVLAVGLCSSVLVGVAVSAAQPGRGGRPATAAEARAITAAYRSSSLGDVNRVPRSRYRFTGIRVSRLAPAWATAQQVPTPAGRATFQAAYGVLVRLANRPGAAGPWVLVDVGSSDVGCGVAPARVLADLRLSCSSGPRL